MGSNLYRELTNLLSDAGCTFVRQAKGSHEIWFSPITNRKFVVPKNTMMGSYGKRRSEGRGFAEGLLRNHNPDLRSAAYAAPLEGGRGN
jgi:hypothetical protein